MLKEFRDFAIRGNVIDLAVAVVIGGAFGKIIASLVNDVLFPLLGVILGGVNLADKVFPVKDAVIKYGVFLQSIIDFVIIAFVVFLMVRSMNRMKKAESAGEPTTKECPYCDTTISIKAKRCPNCTSQL